MNGVTPGRASDASRVSGAGGRCLRYVGLGIAAATVPLAAAQAEGMPQLNFSNPLTTSQVVWLGLIFLTFYLLVSRWALPQVGDVLQRRAATIAADLNDARVAKTEADAAVAALAIETRDAQAKAQAQIAAAVAQAKEQAAARAAEVDQRLDAQLSEAERRIEAARTSAMGALQQVAGETAAMVVVRLAGHEPDQQALAEAVDRAVRSREPK